MTSPASSASRTRACRTPRPSPGYRSQIAADLKQKQLDAAQKLKDQIDAARQEKHGLARLRDRTRPGDEDDQGRPGRVPHQREVPARPDQEGRPHARAGLGAVACPAADQGPEQKERRRGDPLAGLFQVGRRSSRTSSPPGPASVRRGVAGWGSTSPAPRSSPSTSTSTWTAARSRRWWRNTRPATRTAPPGRHRAAWLTRSACRSRSTTRRWPSTPPGHASTRWPAAGSPTGR